MSDIFPDSSKHDSDTCVVCKPKLKDSISSVGYDNDYKDWMKKALKEFDRLRKEKEQKEKEQKEVCRVCGNSFRLDFKEIDKNGICKKCHKKVMESGIRSRLIELKETYCTDCMSHYKACKCPKKIALDNLKKYKNFVEYF